jgi:DNA (cytosine-5)-methyltransferase 1
MKQTFLRRVSLEEYQTNKLTAISLFSGCGGMDLGMMQAGFEVRVMIDNESTCCETLATNFLGPRWNKWGKNQKRKPVILCRDICKTSTRELLAAADLKVGEAGLVTGGFPCQGFSVGGKRRLDDQRNTLYLQCVRVVREALPRYFIFENVPGLASMARGRIIDQICQDLAGCGYDVVWQMLNAVDYGVPQRRVRIFFVGTRRDVMVMPARGRPRLHLGCAPGRYKHPEDFERKYGLRSYWEACA